MADAGFRLSDFHPNQAGIIEVFTSAGMQAALAEAAEGLAGRANAIGGLSHDPTPPSYDPGVDVLDRTAVGYVRAGNAQAAVDQRVHHTLDAINH